MTDPPTILYLTYHGLASPLGRAQCLPYLLRLAEGGRARLSVISFETEPLPTPDLERRVHDLGIEWIALRYHGRPKGLAKILDLALALWAAFRLMRGRRFDVVHARSYVMATAALALKWLAGLPYVFDMLGMLADEYADVGYWSRTGFLYRITKRAERTLLREAGAVIVLTERNARYLRAVGLVRSQQPLTVLPCCVDLQRFGCNGGDAYPRGSAPRLVYSGGLGTWYMIDEMLDFFAAARRVTPELRFRIVSRSDHALVIAAARKRGIPMDTLELLKAHPDQINALLCSSDAGITFITPSFSKQAASPNKFAEYLACGLPVVTNAGVGDLDETMRRDDIGKLVERLAPDAYEEAWRALVADLGAAAATFRARCRAVAHRDFAVERGVEGYAALYRALRDARSG